MTAGCGDDAAPPPPPASPTGAAVTACGDLLAALPGRVAGQDRTGRWGEATATWGNPPIRLRCGVPAPDGFDAVSVCTVVDGVGWFVEESGAGEQSELVMTVVDRPAYVEVRLPVEYLPPAAAMVDLAPAVKATLRRTSTCH
jgi:hypothetical protein